MKSRILWRIFRENRRENSLLCALMLFFNILASILEGASFTLLLACFAVITGEAVTFKWFSFLSYHYTHPLLLFLSGAIFLQLLRSFAVYLGQDMSTLLTVKIQEGVQTYLFRKILRMSYAEVSQFKRGDLSHLVTVPPTFIPSLFDEYNRLTVTLFLSLSYLFLMMNISLPLSALILSLFFLTAFIQKFLFVKISNASHVQTNHIVDLSKQTAQNLEGLKSLHLFQRQEHALAKIESILESISLATLKMKKWSSFIPTLNESLGVILVGISLMVGTLFLRKEGALSTSYLFIFLTLTYRLGNRLQQLMVSRGAIAYYAGPLQRLEEMQAISQISPKTETEKIVPLCFNHSLSFENVSFKYAHKKTEALNDISLTIPKKNVTALVGVSGGGKSSLIDLLLRLYEPSQGKIKLDEIPIETYSLSTWRDLFGVVPQHPFLFNDTIEANIRFGKLKATPEEIVHAAKIAGADYFIQKLPHGYQTPIGESGHRLSGGEKQRISLAQALIRDPEILVLDEATSHLDSHSEQMIQETLKSLRKEKTMLIVAHRLATIQTADLIYVVENGRITEKGTHQDLLKRGGRYQLFWNLQAVKDEEKIFTARFE